MTEQSRRRAPDTADIRRVAQALQEHGVDYAVIGGIAMALHGFPRATKDIDLFLPIAPENNKRLLAALQTIPESRKVLHELKQEWLDQGFSTAADGDISIDLLFVAAGHSFEELRPHLQMVTFDGIPIRTLDIDGMLMTKQTSRDTDIPDRERLRQLRARIVRVRRLLDCLLSDNRAYETSELLANLVAVGRERRSVRALLSTNTSLLAAKVAERSAETGEHYITRTGAEYRAMLRKAAGGGALMAFTTMAKFGLYALALSAFWGGFWAGVNYAVSFVLIQLLHFTVATKQPAMTAPAMAAKLKEIDSDTGVAEFVDKVTHLVRSQVAAVLGNVLVVFPAVLALALLIAQATGSPAISVHQAEHVLESLHLLGPSLFFAAFTGVLLFASSIIAGWTENWFVLNRLDSALHYNPRITRVLGAQRAARWAVFLRENLSGFAANISLGFMLGLVPAFAGFFGLALDVRHVTLSTGQLGAASATLGLEALYLPAFWWAAASLPLLGALNVTVSFYLAFSLALRAQNVSGVDRSRIYAAIRARLRTAPLQFFVPKSSPAT